MPREGKQVKLSTEDYRPTQNIISSGSIPEEGVKIKVTGMPKVREHSVYGKYYFVPVEIMTADGYEKGGINFSHKGLHKLIVSNFDLLKDKETLICGFGKSVTRRYTLELLEE